MGYKKKYGNDEKIRNGAKKLKIAKKCIQKAQGEIFLRFLSDTLSYKYQF